MSITIAPALTAPVLVRTDVPGRPFTWIDPTPFAADEYGHVWTRDINEIGYVHCLLCCETEPGTPDATRPCSHAGLLVHINEERAAWIAEHRVEEATS